MIRFLRDPYYRAALIAWVLLSGWVGVAIYVLGHEWWTASFWPILFVLYVTRIIWKMRRERDALIATDTSRK